MEGTNRPGASGDWAHDDEVRERWGDTEAYRESQRRTSGYGEREWVAATEEGEELAERFAELKRGGREPDAPESVGAAEAHRRHIDHWFYSCSPGMHVALGEMYVSDPRFTAYWDQREPELAVFVRDAIAANVAQAGTPST